MQNFFGHKIDGNILNVIFQHICKTFYTLEQLSVLNMIIYMFNMLKLGPHTYGSYLVLIIEDVISTACLNAENRTAKFKGL